jgi:1-deoxy-D-xylulose-5-phosphate reductoisomerase
MSETSSSANAARSAKRRVVILGSTGSVGRNTVELVAADPDAYEVEALVAQRSVDRLAQQARQLGAKLAVIGDETRYRALKALLDGTGIEVAAGAAAIVEAASRPSHSPMP